MPHNEPSLLNGENLGAGQFLRSRNGLFHALMQEDGNFVVYRGDLFLTKASGYEKSALWSTGPGPAGRTPYHIAMQTDGNLCIYAGDGGATWVCADTFDRRAQDGRVMTLQDDGKLDISGIWSNNQGDGFGDVEFESVAYVLDPEPLLKTKPFVYTSQIGHNFTSIEQIEALTVTHTVTTSSSYKVSTSLKLGTKTTVEAGLPGVVKGRLEVSAEVTTGFEWNKVDTDSIAVTDTVNIKTPAGRAVQAKRTWKTSSFNIPYQAVGKVKFDNYPDMIPIHIEGVYEGVATHDVETWWYEFDNPRGGEKAAVVNVRGDGGEAVVGHDDGNRDGWRRLEEVTPE